VIFSSIPQTVPTGSSGTAVEGERGGTPVQLPRSDQCDRRIQGDGRGDRVRRSNRPLLRGWLLNPSFLRSLGADDTSIPQKDR